MEISFQIICFLFVYAYAFNLLRTHHLEYNLFSARFLVWFISADFPLFIRWWCSLQRIVSEADSKENQRRSPSRGVTAVSAFSLQWQDNQWMLLWPWLGDITKKQTVLLVWVQTDIFSRQWPCLFCSFLPGTCISYKTWLPTRVQTIQSLSSCLVGVFSFFCFST